MNIRKDQVFMIHTYIYTSHTYEYARLHSTHTSLRQISMTFLRTASEIGRSPPSAGDDMEIQKAYLRYNLVTSSVCLRHS